MSELVMYDSDSNSAFPPGADAYAGYVDGHLADQPNHEWIVTHFPAARHVSIALSPAHDADFLDIENNAATVASAAGWYARQRARGCQRPGFYASVSTMRTDLIPAYQAAGIGRETLRLWSAHYGSLLGPHICGPATCGEVQIPMDGTQWTDRALGRNLDASLLAASFFGTTPPPPPAPSLEENMPAGVIRVAEGVRESRTWAAGTVRQIVLYSDWDGLQASAPVVDLRVGHLSSSAYDAGSVTFTGSTAVYVIASNADCNGCSFTRRDSGPATVAWHTNA